MSKEEKIQKTLSKTVRLEESTVEAINKIAKEENRNFNNSVETLLKFAIENRNFTIENPMQKISKDSIFSILEFKGILDNCIDLYTNFFCKKQGVVADGWVGEIKGGINCFSDAFLSFEDIRLDLELNAPKGMIFDWYWDNIENQENSINYYSYIKGIRVETKPQPPIY